MEATLELTNADIVEGPATHSLGVLPGTHGGEPEPHEVAWTVRILDPNQPVTALVVVRSEKAGTVRREVSLGGL